MNGKSLYELRDEVLALDEGERDNLRALLDREEQRQPLRTTVEEDLLWAVLIKLAPVGARHFKSLNEFLRDKRHGVNRADYADAARSTFDLVHEVRPVRHPGQDAAALVELMFECLVKDLGRRRVEITPKTMLQAVPRLRLAIEDCFPGYVAAGMLHRLIRVVA
jgi:hypothetical protein